MTLKERVDRVGRKRVAQKTGIDYNTLSPKLNDFLKWQPGEIDAVEAAVKQIEQEEKAA